MATTILSGKRKDGVYEVGSYAASYTYARSGNYVRYTLTASTTVNGGYSEAYGATTITWTVAGVSKTASISSHSGTASVSLYVDVYGGTTTATTKAAYCNMTNCGSTNTTVPFPVGGTYTVTFDADTGGYFPETGNPQYKSKTVAYGGTYGDMPTPVKPGYAFTGWFTLDGTQQIFPTTQVTLTANQSLVAHYVKTNIPVYVNPGDGVYEVEKAYANIPNVGVKEVTVYVNVGGQIYTLA